MLSSSPILFFLPPHTWTTSPPLYGEGRERCRVPSPLFLTSQSEKFPSRSAVEASRGLFFLLTWDVGGYRTFREEKFALSGRMSLFAGFFLPLPPSRRFCPRIFPFPFTTSVSISESVPFFAKKESAAHFSLTIPRSSVTGGRGPLELLLFPGSQ